jgi:hypothetical protein
VLACRSRLLGALGFGGRGLGGEVGGKAVAFTTNFINSLVSNATVVTGMGYGPKIILPDSGISGIFEDCKTGTFKLAGMDEKKTFRAVGRWCHNNENFIHCGTNFIRDIPSDMWWSR